MILCSPTPVSIIKASLLSQIYNDLPCFKGEQESLGLFMHTDAKNADKATLAPLIALLQETCSLNTSWLTTTPGKTLTHFIAANLRYHSLDRAAVIFAAVEQALRYGHTYCLCGIGSISNIFVARAKAVFYEIHKMLGFIRFHPAPDHTLVAQPKLFHQTADLILRKFVVMYPRSRLVLVLAEQAVVMEHGHITSVPASNYLAYVKNDDFSKTWQIYFQSQYIATHKNINKARTILPKKFLLL